MEVHEVGMDRLKQLENVKKRLELENQVAHGARSMLSVLQMQEASDSSLRDHVQRELHLAESNMAALQAQKQILESAVLPTNDVTFLRPRAIRAVHGMGDLNEDRFRGPAYGLDQSVERIRQLLRALVLILAQTIERTNERTQFAIKDSPAFRIARAQVDIMACITSLLRRYPALCTELQNESPSLLNSLILLTGTGSSDKVRASAMKTLRSWLHPNLVSLLTKEYSRALSLLLSRALVRDISHTSEREQALRFVRSWIPWTALEKGAWQVFSDGLVRTMSAIAHEPEDPLYTTVIETLTEFAMIDPALVARTLSFGPLWRAVCEMPPARSAALIDCLLGLFESPSTRQFIAPNMDLAAALTGFTNVSSTTQENYDQHLSNTEQATLKLLSSWEGLMYLCTDQGVALKSVLAALHLDQPKIQSRILRALAQLLDSETPHLTRNASIQQNSKHEAPQIAASTLRDQYLALVLTLLLDAQLLPGLVFIIRESDSLRPSASHVLNLVFKRARLVFQDSSSELHTFSTLVHIVCDVYGSPHEQLTAKTALLTINDVEATVNSSLGQEKVVRQNTIEETRMQLDSSIDDIQFRSLVRDSMVTTSREHQVWNIPIINELLDGPLQDARRFEEALFHTKLIRRLMSFLRPFSQRYAPLRADPANEQWTEIGRKFFRLLLMQNEGQVFLAEDRFLNELREAFEQLVTNVPDALFNMSAMRSTLVSGYFDFLRLFTESTVGLDLLHAARFFSPLLALSVVDGPRGVFIETLVRTMDYTLGSWPRLFLQRALTAGSEQVRLASTVHLSTQLWLDIQPQKWAISMLLDQLYDAAPQIRGSAMDALREACKHLRMLEAVMMQRPFPHLFGHEDDPLLLLLMSQPAGFDDLLKSGYVTRQLDLWYRHHNLNYVGAAEEALARINEINGPPLPPHFYGQLVATQGGSSLLQGTDHIQQFKHQVRNVIEEHEVLRCKAAIWTLGQIGSSEMGVKMLLEHDAVACLFSLAETAELVSIRATCFHALNFLAKTNLGAEIISKFDWYAMNAEHSLCLPKKGSPFFYIPTKPSATTPSITRLLPAPDPRENHIVTWLSSLGNGAITSTAWHALSRTHAENPERFKSMALFSRAVHLMDEYSLRLTARRHIWHLFDQIPLSLETFQNLEKILEELQVSQAIDAPPSQFKSPKGKQGVLLYPVPAFSVQEGVSLPQSKQQEHHDNPKTTAQALGNAHRSAWPHRIQGFVASHT
ncbi:hypothetical protein MPSI1_001409 [Malassezia psittaci]|uniref:Uncharacterized protein n=1 Tax=Malassezia psittaci TaxID=1821823 RepID=A0AAF0F9G6_9BASI|nr:hypothetical protein MPSI1_001409 [Malassezia psittaci]